MLIKGKEELFARCAIFLTVLVNALDSLAQNIPIKRVRIVDVRSIMLTLTDIEGKATELCDLVEKTVCEVSQLLVSLDVPYCVECRTLLLPNGRMLIRAVDLEFQQLAFALIESGSKIAHFLDRQDKSSKPKDGTIVVMRIIAANVRADVAKLVQIGNVRQNTLQKHENPRLRAGLGMRAIQDCASVI